FQFGEPGASSYQGSERSESSRAVWSRCGFRQFYNKWRGGERGGYDGDRGNGGWGEWGDSGWDPVGGFVPRRNFPFSRMQIPRQCLQIKGVTQWPDSIWRKTPDAKIGVCLKRGKGERISGRRGSALSSVAG